MRLVARLIVAGVIAVAGCSSALVSGNGFDASDGGGPDARSVGDGSYSMDFICEADAGAACPSGQPCPEVPLSSSSCGDLPGVLGHDAIPQTVARPLGCWVGLPYGNPYYSDTQVQCGCMDRGGTTQWLCPI